MENLNNTEPAAAPIAAPDGGDKGLSFRGLFEVFYRPGKLFAQLKDNPKVLVPYLAVIIVSIISIYLIADIIMDLVMSSEAMRQRLQGQELPPQAMQIQKIVQMIMIVIISALVPIFIASFAIFWGNFVYAGKARFKQVLSVALYGQFLFEVGGLIGSLLIKAKGSMMTPFSLGVLAIDQGLESVSFIALSKIDLFNIWEIIVVGIGLATIYGFERNKGYMLSVLSVGLVSVLHIVFALIGSLFM